MARVQSQIFSNFRVVLDQGIEDRSVQPIELNLAAGADGRSSRRLLEKSHLAEAVARPKDVQGDFLAVLARLDHPCAARGQDVERVRLLSFANDWSSERKGHAFEAVHDELPDVWGEKPQYREVV